MSTSYYVQGIIPKDEKYNQMKAVWDACDKAGIVIPQEVNKYFELGDPIDKGHLIEIPKEAQEQGNGEYDYHYDVDLTKIDKRIKILRFVISC
jgi:hypothetical protein